MMEGDASSSSKKKKAVPNDYGFIDTIFSWSLEDIFYQNLFKDKVEQIPLSFQSVNQYFESFVFPLLEETRAQLSSSMEKISEAPFAQVVDLEDSKPYGTMLSDVKVDYWRNRFSNYSKESYKVLPGDILVLADAKPETASDLRRVGVDAEICSPLDRPDSFTNVCIIDCLFEPLRLVSPSFLSLDLRSQKWVKDAGGFAGVNPPMPKLAQGIYGKTM